VQDYPQKRPCNGYLHKSEAQTETRLKYLQPAADLFLPVAWMSGVNDFHEAAGLECRSFRVFVEIFK
jgi:hypothetical protein